MIKTKEICLVALALGTLAGCGGGGSVDGLEPAHRELEKHGLVHDQGQDAYANSYNALYGQAFEEGDADVAALFIRGGLVHDVPRYIATVNEHRSTNSMADPDRVIELLENADPAVAGAQFNREARQVALDEALLDVPEDYRNLVSSCVDFPAYFIGVCVQTNVDVFVRLIEPPRGAREQFGLWVDHKDYVLVSEASGGATVCVSDWIERRDFFGVVNQGHQTRTFGGSFNEDGALIASDPNYFTTMTFVVRSGGDADLMTFAGTEYSRVTTMNDEVWDAIQECL